MPSASALFSPPPPAWKSWDFYKKFVIMRSFLRNNFLRVADGGGPVPSGLGRMVAPPPSAGGGRAGGGRARLPSRMKIVILRLAKRRRSAHVRNTFADLPPPQNNTTSLWGRSCQVCFRLLCCYGNAMINSKLGGYVRKSTPNHWLLTKGRVHV
jgi:hypothetical protein